MFSFHNIEGYIFWQKGDLTLKKLLKWFGIFAVIGTAIGLAIAYICKNNSDDLDENETDFTEDEDFDLDADLQPAEREYVSLKKDSDEIPKDDAKDTDASEDK